MLLQERHGEATHPEVWGGSTAESPQDCKTLESTWSLKVLLKCLCKFGFRVCLLFPVKKEKKI